MRQLFGIAQQGKTWWKIDADVAAVKLNCDRKHIVHAVELIEEKQVAEIKVSGARKRFSRLDANKDIETLVTNLSERFARREASDITRIADVLKLVEHNGCQTNALVAHFGEIRDQPCGHCTFCKTGKPTILPTPTPLPEIDSRVSIEELKSICNAHLGSVSTAAPNRAFPVRPFLTRAK